MRLGVGRVVLLQGLPERDTAHDDGVVNAEFVEGKLVLAEERRLGPSSVRRLDLAGQNFIERGLAGPADGAAAARQERSVTSSKRRGLRKRTETLSRSHQKVRAICACACRSPGDYLLIAHRSEKRQFPKMRLAFPADSCSKATPFGADKRLPHPELCDTAHRGARCIGHIKRGEGRYIIATKPPCVSPPHNLICFALYGLLS